MRTLWRFLRTRSTGHLAYAIAVLGLIALIVFFLENTPANVAAASSPQSPATSISVKPPTGSNVPRCPGSGPAEIQQGENYELVKGGLSGTDIEADKAKLLEVAKANPVFVVGYAFERKLAGYIDANSLIKDGCWTTEGYELSLKVQGSLQSATARYGMADVAGRNSGSDNGRLVVDEQPGINGDRRTIEIVHRDGSMTVILVRCGNILFWSEVPEVPRGRTDNPSSPEEPQEPPAPVCPPGQTGTPPDCVTPKQSSQQPENRNNVPTQVKPDQPVQNHPGHEQPVQPQAPPPVYQTPAPPAGPTTQRPALPTNQGAPTINPVTGAPCALNPDLC